MLFKVRSATFFPFDVNEVEKRQQREINARLENDACCRIGYLFASSARVGYLNALRWSSHTEASNSADVTERVMECVMKCVKRPQKRAAYAALILVFIIGLVPTIVAGDAISPVLTIELINAFHVLEFIFCCHHDPLIYCTVTLYCSPVSVSTTK